MEEKIVQEIKAPEPLKKSSPVSETLARSLCAPTSTDAEWIHFKYTCKQYNLNPLKKEIYFMKYGTKASHVISRDGLLKIANTEPNFDGLESDAVYKDDVLVKRDNGSFLISYGPHHYTFNKENLIGAFCNVFRKDRSMAIAIYVSLKECKKDSPIWNQYTNAMIIKSAEVAALKKAFILSGLDESHDTQE